MSFTKQHIPNALTLARLLLAGVFFLVLNQYRYTPHPPPNAPGLLLWFATAIFIIAMLTDIADGYLARKWNVESTFGRIMDPFCDKVIVLGTLIYLAGNRFTDPQALADGDTLTMISGIYPWMVAVMLARELLVTGIRGELESQGIKFGAQIWGKLKTLFQSIGIPTILIIIAIDPKTPGFHWTVYLRDFFAYGMTLLTLISGLPYLTSAMRSTQSK